MCGEVNGAATLDCIFPLIANIVLWLMSFVGLVAVIMIIYAGILLITSGGDPKKLEVGKKTMIYAVLGIFLIFLSYFIVNFIAGTTGLYCINPSNPLSFTSCTGRSSGGGTW